MEELLPSKIDDSAVLKKQAGLNRSTRGQWQLYASHRQELERLLVPDRQHGRICILGAGNCNDLDLRWLVDVYQEVTLVDIDLDALHRAAKFQKVESSPKLQLRGGVDLTGVAKSVGSWGKIPPTMQEVQTVIQVAATPNTELVDHLHGPFDVVLSPCVLSQLITPLRDTIGDLHPLFPPLMSAIRWRHLRLMFDLLAPGARGVFASDLVSSTMFQNLARVEKEELPSLMRSMLLAGKCLEGLEPKSIAAVLTRIAVDRGRVDLSLSEPWLWHLGLSKTYLVYAITFSKMANDVRSAQGSVAGCVVTG